MVQNKLAQFTQKRNWLIARMRGAIQMFNYRDMEDFSPKIKEEAGEVRDSIEALRIKLSGTWPEQKAYFLKKHPIKKA